MNAEALGLRASAEAEVTSPLSPEFRLQLQVLERVAQQAGAVRDVASRQDAAAAQIAGLRRVLREDAKELQDLVTQRTERLAVDIRGLQEGQRQILNALADTPAAPRPRTLDLWRKAMRPEAAERPKQGGMTNGEHLLLQSAKDCYMDDPYSCEDMQLGLHNHTPRATELSDTGAINGGAINGVAGSFSNSDGTCEKGNSNESDPIGHRHSGSQSSRKINHGDDKSLKGWMMWFATSQYLDLISGTVIAANVAFMAAQTQQQIQHVLEHSGATLVEDPRYVEAAYFFQAFYVLEIIFKISVFRGSFFTGPDWRWNNFDFTLVVTGFWDILAALTEGGKIGVTWLRLLRMPKLLKMLRVVRVMRSFRELRMMMLSIVSSFMTLFWSVFMLALVMFVFGVCFVQAMTGYLDGRPHDEVPQETLEAIRSYYSGVGQATVTLFMAVTGGADWEALAAPLRRGAPLYWGVFLFYISFSIVALMNLLTGLFVDAAMKVATVDQQNVIEEVYENEADELSEFRNFMNEIKSHDINHTLCWRDFYAHRRDKKVKTFLDVMEMDMRTARHVFRRLEMNGHAGIEDFIQGCMRSNEDMNSLDIMSVLSDCRTANLQSVALMRYLEEQFQHINRVFAQLGATPEPKLRTLAETLSKANVLPVHWNDA